MFTAALQRLKNVVAGRRHGERKIIGGSVAELTVQTPASAIRLTLLSVGTLATVSQLNTLGTLGVIGP